MRRRRPFSAPIAALLLAALWLCAWPAGGIALADDAATPTATPTVTSIPAATAEPTLTPVPTATPLPTATRTPRPRPTATAVAGVVREGKRHKKRHKRPLNGTSVASTATPTVTPTAAAGQEGARHHRHKKKHAVAPKPTPTATPGINLTADDSVAPVTCNGPARPPAAHPFLTPPYRDWTSIVSYFDHDLPDFVRDGSVVTATGLQAGVDPAHQRSDFPAYWSSGIRQYVYYDGHNGYDFNVSYVPIYAAAKGKVIFSAFEYPDAPDHGYGQMIMIDHGNGYVTLYGHLSKLLVKRGQSVRRGQRIAISGNTGHSTGPHLHFTVFHNCTPTDPYGWSGDGQDPLFAYQGETSEFLWIRSPLVDNPLPGWPGLNALPVPPTERILLLQLPPAHGGTAAFTAALRKEAKAVQRALRLPSADTTINLLEGSIHVVGPLDAARIFTVPHVVSITSPDTIEGAKTDVLSALARAALSTPHHALLLNRAHRLTGSLIRWGGRTLLVGRASRGEHVTLRLGHGRGGTGLSRIDADPVTGAYAVDLGSLSTPEFNRLQQLLRSSEQKGRRLKVQPVRNSKPTRVTSHVPSRSSKGTPVLLGVALLLLAAAAISAAVWRTKLQALLHRP